MRYLLSLAAALMVSVTMHAGAATNDMTPRHGPSDGIGWEKYPAETVKRHFFLLIGGVNVGRVTMLLPVGKSIMVDIPIPPALNPDMVGVPFMIILWNGDTIFGIIAEHEQAIGHIVDTTAE